jgi:hypothetical protein
VNILSNEIRYKICENIIWRKEKSKDNPIILRNKEGGSLLLLNGTASIIFEMCDGKNSFNDIKNTLTKLFDAVEQTLLEKDIKDFLRVLEDKKLIKKVI